MNTEFENYKKKKNYLFCVDSDGCAIATMDLKHKECFGPCMVEEWNLEEWKDDILNRWNEINLYSKTRGINRFRGLAMALKEIDSMYCKIDGIEELCKWVEETPELSNYALESYMKENIRLPILEHVLSWSQKVNEYIKDLPKEKKRAFEGVRETLEYARLYGDIVIVSSANRQAVEDEWEYNNLLDIVDFVLVQDMGSKAFCIAELLKKGYEKEKVIMIGDAPGDLEAAQKNDILFFPIMVNKEKESWEEFRLIAFEKIVQAGDMSDYMKQKTEEFWSNLHNSKFAYKSYKN